LTINTPNIRMYIYKYTVVYFKNIMNSSTSRTINLKTFLDKERIKKLRRIASKQKISIRNLIRKKICQIEDAK